MSEQFKKGQKVRCIRGAGPGGVQGGITYTVKSVFDNMVNLQEVGGGWFSSRFEAAMSAKPRDYVADHARRTLRKFGFTKEQAALFVKGVQAGQPAYDPEWLQYKGFRVVDGKLDLGCLSRKMPAVRPHQLVMNAINWDNTAKALGVEWGVFEELYDTLSK